MNIARPRDGFNLIVKDDAASVIQGYCVDDVFHRQWYDLLEDMRFTGHRRGEPIKTHIKGSRVLAEGGFDGEPYRITVVYRALGDTLTIYGVKAKDSRAK